MLMDFFLLCPLFRKAVIQLTAKPPIRQAANGQERSFSLSGYLAFASFDRCRWSNSADY